MLYVENVTEFHSEMPTAIKNSYQFLLLHRLLYFVVCCSLSWAVQDGEWVTVRKSPQKDWWKPSLTNAGDDELHPPPPPPMPLKVTFAEPATHWTDAIPIGNGRLGAMVWGGIPSELLQLNGI